MQPATVRWLRIAQSGYFGLIFLLMAWYGWLAPPQVIPTSVVLLVLVGPLMFALRGVLYASTYTFAWVSMLALLYFTHGVVEGYSDATTRPYALTEVLLSVMLWSGAMLYTRKRSRELKAAKADSAEA